MSVRWFDRQGRRLSAVEADVLLSDNVYVRVAEEAVGPYWVSTIWLGLDHNLTQKGPPRIFETAVFFVGEDGEGGLGDIFQTARYATEEEALKGHDELVTLLRATTTTSIEFLQENHEHQNTEGPPQAEAG
jgi:hypothetical protein